MNANERQSLPLGAGSSPLSLRALKRREHHTPLHSRLFAFTRNCRSTACVSTGLTGQSYGFTGQHGDGELLAPLWVAEQKLANGVEITAELWTLIGQQPATTALVVVSADHAPRALTGQEILELKDSRQITLHPARYRIVEVAQ